jgi:shikimate kinase
MVPDGVENVVLIGYRGCGKTRVGRALGARLGWRFVDTDEEVEARAGRRVAEIFAADGEAVFRRLEQAVVADVARGVGQVIAVGGGAVLAEANRAVLQRAGICVWLVAPAEVLRERIERDARSATQRPALTALDGLEEVRHLLGEREALYASIAEHVVRTDGRSVAEVVEAVLSVLRDDAVGAEDA